MWPLLPEAEHELKRFSGRMLEQPDETWTANERLWQIIFGKVARSYPQLTLDQSFGISFLVLCRCYSSKKHEQVADFYHYLLRSCRNAHKHDLGIARRQRQGRRVPLDKKWPAPCRIRSDDNRLDLRQILDDLDPELRQVVELMHGLHNRREWRRAVAEKLQVNGRRAAYLVKKAGKALRNLLGEEHHE
jgi:hypothetical protein